MYMKKPIKKVIKKKVLKKGSDNPEVKTAPAPIKLLKKGVRYPSGVSKEQMIEAFGAVLYVAGKKLTMRVKDLYAALLNRVKPYCNQYDLLPYESSTKDPSIRKKLEFTMGDLRRAGYLSPKNPEGTVTLLKVIPPGLKL
jgi:hypothetical protein